MPLLSEQRREQVLRFKHILGRRTCVAAYLLLRKALLEVYGITEKPVFEYGEHGKPSIIGHPEIHFNLSHCKEAAICVVSNHPIGVDVESVREYKESLARYLMNDEGTFKYLLNGDWSSDYAAATADIQNDTNLNITVTADGIEYQKASADTEWI
ncbi:MAG: hypothetical protein II431_04225, partial [Prevotella sp.]|nr:hypothetical protein [Prevotella sp.]